MNNPLSLNLYTYAHNIPLIYIDPSGHKVEVYVGAYKVMKTTFNHASIIIFIDEESEYWDSTLFSGNFDEESGMQYMTIGAGSVDGKLVAGSNRKQDLKLDIKTEKVFLEETDDDKIPEFLGLLKTFQENTANDPQDYRPNRNLPGYNKPVLSWYYLFESIHFYTEFPVGTQMDEVVQFASNEKGWSDLKIDDTNGYYKNVVLGEIVGQKHVSVYIGTYHNFKNYYFRTDVQVYFGFNENSELIDIRIRKILDSL